MTRVWVLLFGEDENQEGIYSIKMNTENLIIAFVDKDDAIRYGLMLEAQDFFSPRIEPIDLRELEEFCEQYSYRLRVLEPNELMTPPEANLAKVDWQNEEAELDAMRRQLERLLRMGED
jgi:hypothetical protein